MIKVLIVNDSLMAREAMKRILKTDPEFEVCGTAMDGHEGALLAKDTDPDVVLMDIRMPNMNGVESVRWIMREAPCPILIVTGSISMNMNYIYDCMNLGALEVIKTPSLPSMLDSDKGNEKLEASGAELLARTKMVASLKKTFKSPATHTPLRSTLHAPRSKTTKVLVVGASTGGPNALGTVLAGLPADLNASVILIQHIGADFAEGLAAWLSTRGPLVIKLAKGGELLFKGRGYLAAAENKNLVVGEGFSLVYEEAKKNTIYIPNIDTTFESLARYYGHNVIGVLLTGMGADGAKGLLSLRKAGARTIAQDTATAVIDGMPKAARDIGAAEFVLPLDAISQTIVRILNEGE